MAKKNKNRSIFIATSVAMSLTAVAPIGVQGKMINGKFTDVQDNYTHAEAIYGLADRDVFTYMLIDVHGNVSDAEMITINITGGGTYMIPNPTQGTTYSIPSSSSGSGGISSNIAPLEYSISEQEPELASDIDPTQFGLA